ncbi:MAG: hypothetical protein EAZ91_18945 [Cytophagales bacterium]|nr:MAG: hypothetical protein EAZ91_18945 [Cytophagales bacterium]
MKPVASISEWQPNPEFLQRIYSGYSAELKYQEKQRPWGENLARNVYKIPVKEVSKLTQKALNAALNTLRNVKDPKPGLLKRMIQDQAAVYHYQRGHLKGSLVKQYQGIAKRFLIKYLYLQKKIGLSVDYEAICEEATNTFFLKIREPEFVLSSALPSYLIGILINQYHSSIQPKWTSQNFTPTPNQTLSVAIESIRYFQYAHDTVARHISQLGVTCQQIILRRYGIDPEKVDAVSIMPVVEQPLSEAEFRERFTIGMEPSTGPVTLKTVAAKLGIDPRQVSREHLNCLDALVLNVANELFEESAPQLPDLLRDALQARIDEARARQDKR